MHTDTKFYDCSGTEATRKAVTELMKAMPLKADFIFYDHGDEQGLVAHGGGDYIIDKTNDELLIDRIVYTLACLWGADGGWQAKRHGARAIHCYVEVVGFMTTALKDFQEAFNYGFKLLHERMQQDLEPNFEGILALERKKMTELSDKLMKQGNFMAAAWMNRNCDSLRFYNGKDEPPTSKCFWRRLAVRILGKRLGWTFLKTVFFN